MKPLNPPGRHKPLPPAKVQWAPGVVVCKTCNGHGWLCKKPCWDLPRLHDGKPCPTCDKRGEPR